MAYEHDPEVLYDGQPEQTWLYHPELAPKGQRFYTDDLPPDYDPNAGPEDGPQWVDTPAKFPGYRAPLKFGVNTEAPSRPEVTQHWMYHKAHGGKVFRSDHMPAAEWGWFDNKVDAQAWEPPEGYDPSADPALSLPTQLDQPDEQPPQQLIGENRQPPIPEDDAPPVLDPEDFADVDTFMEAWCEDSITEDMADSLKDSIKKEGLERYALARYGENVDRRHGVSKIYERIRQLETDQ